jgi:hypothetical protein
MDNRGSLPGGGSNGTFFLFSTASTAALGPTQHPILWVPEALTPGIKRPRREADHSSLSSFGDLHGVVLS